MTTTTTASQRPQFGKLYGITYAPETDAPIVRAPRVLRVGIGIPKGRAIQVFLFNGQWHIRHGVFERNKLVMKTVYQGGATVNGVVMENTRKAAEAWHRANKHLAAVSNRPQKVSYLTFTRRTLVEENGIPVEMYEPDFEAIEAHGDIPTRIPVRITSDNPLYQEYAWWSVTQLKCHGDGRLAERAISAGSASDMGWSEAKASGQKMFTYAPCYKTGCPLAGNECKPHSTLNIQLEYAMRLGTTAYFNSTGQVTADRLFSSLFDIRESIERLGCSITGAPLDLVLGSFRANYEGKPAAQPCVSLELRAEGADALRQLLRDQAWIPIPLDRVAAEPIIMHPAIEAGVYDLVESGDSPAPATDPDFDDEDPAARSTAATATVSKQDAIARQLSEKKATEKPADDKPRLPWINQVGMNALMQTMQERIGTAAFQSALHRHSIDPDTLAWNDPVAMVLWSDMKALPDIQKGELF